MSKFAGGEIRIELIQELRDLAERGVDVPELVEILQQHLELDDKNALLPAILYFRAAFDLSLREAMPLREWLGGRDRSEIDSLLIPAMYRSKGYLVREKEDILMKKVIALSGPPNYGKTQTIKKVLELLVREYSESQRKEETIRENESADIRLILLIDNMKIGIESLGDPSTGNRLGKSLDIFVQEECQVIVCATRTSGQTVEAVADLKSQGYEVVWLNQGKVDRNFPSLDEKIAKRNEEMAKRIVAEVKGVIASNKSLVGCPVTC